MDPDSVAKQTYGVGDMGVTDSLLEWIFGDYPSQYGQVVALSAAKQQQYLDMVGMINWPTQHSSILRILEPGPSMYPLLIQALNEKGISSSQYEVVQVDRFPAMMPSRSGEGLTRESIVQASLTNLPFPSNSFDVVFISSVLLYISDRVMAMEEAYRVLKPGGRLIVSELDSAISPGELSARVMAAEIEKIKNHSLGENGGLDSLQFTVNMVKHFGPKIRFILGSILRNILIVRNELSGFDEATLQNLMVMSGYKPETVFISRTYAGSYHLVVADKES